MQKTESDLARAFQWARGRAFGAYQTGHNRGMITTPTPAALALVQARKALAALPSLEEAAKAAGAALEAQRPIDCRRYAPAWVKVTEEAKAARKALQAGQAWRYSGPVWRKGGKAWPQSEKGLFFFETEEQGLRNSQEAAGFLGRDAGGYYADSFQENTCAGLVAQLPSRNGKSRFVAGYQFSESDNGLGTFDLGRIYESDFESERDLARRQIGKAYWTPAMESPGYWAQTAHETARKEAARAADSMAERAAEQEREYQEAYQAGADWANLKEEESGLRTQALAILAERRSAMGRAGLSDSGFFALCDLIRASVKKTCRDIAKSRAKRAELKDSVYGSRGREAFSDGAGVNLWQGKAY